jgi:hypothetical protein
MKGNVMSMSSLRISCMTNSSYIHLILFFHILVVCQDDGQWLIKQRECGEPLSHAGDASSISVFCVMNAGFGFWSDVGFGF